MTSPAHGILRLTRAGALALAIVALSLTAHVLAGGMSPSPVYLGVVTVPVIGLSLVVTSRRVRLPVVTGLFAVTQLALHRSFDVLSAATSGSVVGMPGAHRGEHLSLSSSPAMSGHSGGVWMTVAHVLATLVLVLVLSRGEAAVWTLWQRLVGRVPAAVGPLSTFAVPAAHGGRVLTSRLTTGLRRVRGPPGAPRPA